MRMRPSTARLVSVFASAMLIASATAPVGTITAPGSIKIGGADVPATAAAAVPVGIGDQISTTNSSALIRFDQRGVVTLGKNSTVKVQAKGDETLICLIEGSYHYKFVAGSKLAVCKEDKVVAKDLEGSLSMGKSLKAPLIVASSAGGAFLIAAKVKEKSKDCPEGHGENRHDCRVIE